ncbi:MAG: T9SS type A sorting domain-containing protein [Crocinitomicaceae bacterium]|nr:T9SS type A sorting domain-containing protein [Crocinitomicaceae bacterium]
MRIYTKIMVLMLDMTLSQLQITAILLQGLQSNRYFFGQDVLIIKIDSLGDVVWASNFGDASSDDGKSIIETADGGFVAIGTLNSFATSSDDIYLIKVDAFGDFVWEKTWGDSLGDHGYDIVEIPSDSGFAIAANYFAKPYLIRTDKYGDTLWTKSYADSANIYSITHTLDDGFLLVGMGYGSMGTRGFAKKVDATGNELWVTYFIGGGGERLYDCMELPNGNFALVGESLEDSPPPKADAILRVLDNSGNSLWYETYGGAQSDHIENFCLSSDGGFVMTGKTHFTSGSNIDDQMYVVKADETGALGWEVNFGDDFPGSEGGFGICTAADGGYVICGQKTSGGEAYLYIIKLNENGSTVSINELPTFKPFEVYPNPISDYATITFGEQIAENSVLTLYSISGEIVFTQEINSGISQFNLYRGDWISGTYIITVKNSTTQFSKKVIYL